MNRKKQAIVECAVAAALSAAAGGVHASGFQLIEQNASGLGNAYAGQAAAAEDASTVYFNPAGLTRLPGRQGVAAGHVIVPSARFNDNGSRSAVSTPAGAGPFPFGGNGGDGGALALVPSTYLSAQVTPRVFVGVGINVPFGLKTDYDPDWQGRFHALKTEARSVNINPAVAFKLTDTLSIGAGVNYMHFEAELTKAVNYSFVGALAGLALPAGTEGTNKIEGESQAWGWNVGLLWKMTPRTDVGIAYRSAVSHHLHGNVHFFDRPASLTQVAGLSPAVFNQVGDSRITATLRLPASATVAIKHRLTTPGWMGRGGWEILADYTWTEWNSLRSLDIIRSSGQVLESTPFNWKNTRRVALGLNYHANPRWTYRLGTAFDETPTRNEYRTPRIPDQDRTWLALGAQYRISKTGTVDVGYAHLFVKEAPIEMAGPPAVTPLFILGRGALSGTFDNKVDIFSVQYRHLF